jgi:hypothetical protein
MVYRIPDLQPHVTFVSVWTARMKIVLPSEINQLFLIIEFSLTLLLVLMVLFQLEVRKDYIYAMEAWRDFYILDVHPLYSCSFLFHVRKCSSNLHTIAWGGKFEHFFVNTK